MFPSIPTDVVSGNLPLKFSNAVHYKQSSFSHWHLSLTQTISSKRLQGSYRQEEGRNCNENATAIPESWFACSENSGNFSFWIWLDIVCGKDGSPPIP